MRKSAAVIHIESAKSVPDILKYFGIRAALGGGLGAAGGDLAGVLQDRLSGE